MPKTLLRDLLTYTFLATGLLFITTPTSAIAACDPTQSAACIGQPCALVGQSMLEKGEKNIVVCLNPDVGTQPIWKSTSAPDSIDPPAGTLCGLATYGYNNKSNIAYPKGYKYDWITPCRGVNKCPAGWSIQHKMLGENWDDHSKYSAWGFAVCSKN